MGDDVAWSLFRSTAADDIILVCAGLHHGLGGLRRRVLAAVPQQDEDRGGLWDVTLAHAGDEEELAGLVGPTLLPVALTTALLESGSGEIAHTVTIAPRGWLSTVAWEAVGLTRGADVRLVERARVLGGLAPGLHAGRRLARDPGSRSASAVESGPALAVVDAGPAADTPHPLYPGLVPDELVQGLQHYDEAANGELSADEFGELLRETHWSRLLYLGHIRAGNDEHPASAALVLAEGGRAEYFSARNWIAQPERWPAPQRVALIGCGGDDSGPAEHAGLALAAVNAGAELVTTTRWTLPTDRQPPTEIGTSRLTAAVAAAHRATDPVETLRLWQAGQLGLWRSIGAVECSPLLWSSLVTYSVEGTEE